MNLDGRNVRELVYADAVKQLREVGFTPEIERVRVNISNAEALLMRGLRYFIGSDAKWLPEYKEVAEWMADNYGRGLLCSGNCGRGKTEICTKVMPVLMHHFYGRIMLPVSAQEMNSRIDEVKSKHLIVLDDVGTEDMAVTYGNRRWAFCEVVDEAEKKGNLLIITTNYSMVELAKKYGERTVDRLRSLTRYVQFRGESLRK